MTQRCLCGAFCGRVSFDEPAVCMFSDVGSGREYEDVLVSRLTGFAICCDIECSKAREG